MKPHMRVEQSDRFLIVCNHSAPTPLLVFHFPLLTFCLHWWEKPHSEQSWSEESRLTNLSHYLISKGMGQNTHHFYHYRWMQKASSASSEFQMFMNDLKDKLRKGFSGTSKHLFYITSLLRYVCLQVIVQGFRCGPPGIYLSY